jgi:uncharacterized protein DUF3619
MTTEHEIAARITAVLDHGTDGLRAGTAYRLQQARAAALARLEPAYAEQAALTPAFAGAASGRHGGAMGQRSWSSPVRWLGIVLIAAAATFGWQQWRAFQQVQEIQELDAQLLSSELPLDAYLDRGFLNWLKDDAEH